jgi:plasmid stabilization system protein ParE
VAALRALNLRFSVRAKSQLASIHTYIGNHNPAGATRVGVAIRDAAETLRYFPLAGRSSRSSGTREWVARGLPYILVDEVGSSAANEVMILGVFHCAQNRSSDDMAE